MSRSLTTTVRTLVVAAMSFAMLFLGLGGAPAHAAVPIDCATSNASLYQPTGGTWAGYTSARCNRYYYLRTIVKENGVVIRDNYQSTWQAPWVSSGLSSNPYFYCVPGRGYQEVSIVYFWNGSASYQGGYWTTGAPRTLC